MSQLEDSIESLKNAVAPPGSFDTLYPDADDSNLLLRLLDGFGQAQLWGYLSEVSVNDDGETTPDLSRAQIALVILYAAKRVVDMRLLDLKTHVRYEAGSAVFEQDQGVSTLVQLQKEYAEQLNLLQKYAREDSYATGFVMVDLYMSRALGSYAGLGETGYDDDRVHVLDALGGG